MKRRILCQILITSLKNIIVHLIFVIVLFGCSNSYEDMPDNVDPFIQSFMGTDIKLMVGIGDFDLYDSLFFDEKGRLVRRRKGWSKIMYEYNSKNYLTRLYSKSDVFRNEVLDYAEDKGMLKQYVYRIKGDSWEFEMDDLSKVPYDTIYYSFLGDQINKIDFGDYYLLLDYNSSRQLASKRGFNDDDLYFNEQYLYENDTLKNVITIVLGDTVSIKYFSDGILDSLIEDGVKYKYTTRIYY